MKIYAMRRFGNDPMQVYRKILGTPNWVRVKRISVYRPEISYGYYWLRVDKLGEEYLFGSCIKDEPDRIKRYFAYIDPDSVDKYDYEAFELVLPLEIVSEDELINEEI